MSFVLRISSYKNVNYWSNLKLSYLSLQLSENLICTIEFKKSGMYKYKLRNDNRERNSNTSSISTKFRSRAIFFAPYSPTHDVSRMCSMARTWFSHHPNDSCGEIPDWILGHGSGNESGSRYSFYVIGCYCRPITISKRVSCTQHASTLLCFFYKRNI